MTIREHDTPAARTARVTPQELHPLTASGRSLYTDWQMSSYSAMAMLSEYEQEVEVAASRAGRLVPVPGLPMGASFGNVIHDLLDELSFAVIARGEQDMALLRQKCLRYGVGAEPEGIGRLLQQVVTTPLLPASSTDNFSLAMVHERRCLKEMGFYFHLGLLVTERINEILADEPTVVPLAHRTMRGYLTGFIDLVCEFAGKYYILDYKTNFLGRCPGRLPGRQALGGHAGP